MSLESIFVFDDDVPDDRWSDAGAWSSSEDHEGRVQRIKALACTAPLHELEANKTHRDGDWGVYDFYTLGLAAVDVVVDQMGFESGAAIGLVDEALTALAAAQAPQRTAEEHERVAHVTRQALTQRNRVSYSDPRVGERVVFDFGLLTVHEGADGALYLRATNEAINVLLGALHADIESEQAAADAQLENLIRRQRLDHAAQAAKRARYRSIQYAEDIRRILAETRRDVRSVDWVEDVPARLDDALDHLSERVEVERRMLASLRDLRDTAESNDKRARAAGLIDRLDDCVTRHLFLQGKVMDARQVFLEEQERQALAPPGSLSRISVQDELLVPMLAASRKEADEVITTFAERVLGLATVRAARLFGVVDLLLEPPRPPDSLGAEIDDDREFEAAVDPAAFSDAAWEAVNKLFAGIGDEGESLSTLLRAVDDDEVADLLRLRALHAFAPTFAGYATSHRTTPTLLAVPAGGDVADSRFAGEDLRLLWVQAAAPVTPPVAARDGDATTGAAR